ncbi:ankyrin repeat domain-containing protein [Actinomadura viridis]|uniref:ankyrin repeat domain-containing protein n=1 Tax=Actinomadura viridis TaxID=58110 RepID=UPI003691BD8C
MGEASGSQPRPGTAACGPFNRKHAASRERARRFGVPRWRIERATERRLAGDWRGACDAAGVRVSFDLAVVAAGYGAAVAEALEDDLRHLAPDLLRWHVEQDGHPYVLAAYGDAYLHLLPSGGAGLGFGRPAGRHAFVAPRHVWDVRRAGELLDRHGGRGRAPFFRADGTPVRGAGGGDGAGDDPVALAERATLLHERGEVEAAFAAAGLDLRLHERFRDEQRAALALTPLALHRIEPELRRLARAGAGHRFLIRHHLRPTLNSPVRMDTGVVILAVELPEDGGGPRVTYVRSAADVGARPGETLDLPDLFWQRSPDLDLVRAGRLTPEELHPLVRAALFPARPAVDGPAGPSDLEGPPVARVRCRGEWHEVAFRNGRLHTWHDEDEWRREKALRALGGAVTGCFAVREEWAGPGTLPRALREQRRELFARVDRGDTQGVLRLLDVGYDAHARDGEHRSLLHWLHRLDHEELLPWLLAAGLDIEARDRHGRTPLLTAVDERARASTVRALLEAGARVDARGTGPLRPHTVLDAINLRRRADLDFLRERLEAEGLS